MSDQLLCLDLHRHFPTGVEAEEEESEAADGRNHLVHCVVDVEVCPDGPEHDYQEDIVAK